ncbi:MAG: alpha/beta fold hydrolase [Gemmatimonadaceae bacterium]|nr:alpha/beta fold hydrolase [Gemmatimonadaceae bacterium]
MYLEHLRVPAGEGVLHVTRAGRGGRPIVLVHGFGSSSFLWRHVAVRLATAGEVALAPDLLGYGESDRPLDVAYGLIEQSRALDHALTALRVSRAIVVGIDLGALVAIDLAARFPERVGRLVLVSPSDPDDLPPPEIRALQRSAARLAVRLDPGLFGALAVLEPYLAEAAATPQRIPRRLAARYAAPYVGRDGLQHLLLLARSLEAGQDEPLALDRVRAPVTVVRGSADRFCTSEGAPAIARRFAQADLATIEGAGRLVPEEAPAPLAALLLELAALGGAALDPPVFSATPGS